jgi:protein arginine kinase activator
MICQKCQERPATVHLTEIEGTSKKEIHLCEQCASSDGEPGSGGSVLEKLQSLLSPGFDKPTSELARLTCSACGTTYAAFRARGRFGCAACYEAFRRGVEPLVEKIHGATRHVGKVPESMQATLAADNRLRDLRADLEEAVGAEEYERAAEIRDTIRQLEVNGGSE